MRKHMYCVLKYILFREVDVVVGYETFAQISLFVIH